MAGLNAEQRNYYYLFEGDRTSVHKSLLAALHQVHQSPRLADGELGLGISPANRIPLEQVNSFAEQVQFAANAVRAVTDRLTAQGWKGADVWDAPQGRYTDRFVQSVATGFTPSSSDLNVTRLEATNSDRLRQAYLADINLPFKGTLLPQNLAYLDRALLTFIERLPRYYSNLTYQREALLEASRIWRKLDTQLGAIAILLKLPETDPSLATVEPSRIDPVLIQFISQISPFYAGYPHQREALLRLVQYWRQLDSREEAIASLGDNQSAETNIRIIDPALIAFAQRLPQFYQGKGEQRNALTETFRIWRNLDSRTAALTELGVDPQLLSSSNPDRQALANAAALLDRQLLLFIRRVPIGYQETPSQREALIRLVQLWRNFDSREQSVQSLLEDLRRMQDARRGSIDAPPVPMPDPNLPRPARWTPDNIQIYASIIPNGSLTWAEATNGGTRMPPNMATVDAIIRIARMAQSARDRIGRPFHVTSWYRPPDVNQAVGGASLSRHIVGDAIDFYCDGLTGDQLYRFLDPWWTGGLGRYSQYPYLCHLDARNYRARWTH
jgi:hypothetical protein